MNGLFLNGIRVIGLTWVWAGPWMGAVLADMGAEVIKVESHTRIDNARNSFFGVKSYNCGWFNMINRGTKSCTLDLKQPAGSDLFKKLIKISDIVIENFPPRVMPSLGLGYQDLQKIKPDIIMISLNGYGSKGPEKDYVAYASTVESVGGIASSFGYPGKEPALGMLNSADPISSMYGALTAIGAVFHRHRTGRGLHVDIAESEAATSVVPEVIMEYIMNGRVKPRMGNRDEIIAPHGCYPCKGHDNWVAITVTNDEEWYALCRIMGNPDWSKSEKFSDKYHRWRNQDELNSLIGEWTKNFTHYEVMQRLQDVGIPAGPSMNTEELINDPHIRERGAIFEQDHQEAGRSFVCRSPWTSALTSSLPPAPCLGEHNDYVFKELLGISDDNFEQLIERKIIY